MWNETREISVYARHAKERLQRNTAHLYVPYAVAVITSTVAGFPPNNFETFMLAHSFKNYGRYAITVIGQHCLSQLRPPKN